jgi:hypothetical protein
MAERTQDLVVPVLGERAAAVALILDRGNQHRADQVATVGLRRPNGQSPDLQPGVAPAVYQAIQLPRRSVVDPWMPSISGPRCAPRTALAPKALLVEANGQVAW